jgi:hypothetical protein
VRLRTATLLVCAVDFAAWVIIGFGTFGSGSDAATRGLDQGAGVLLTALFLGSVVPAVALVLAGRAPVTALVLALAFPAGFVVAFVAALIAFA